MDKLHFPGVSVDIQATKERVEFFQDIFAGVLTDNHTLGDNPENAYRWVQIAREECARVGKG